MIVLHTPRLDLRAYDADRDADAAYEIYSDAEVVRYLGGGGKVMPSVQAQRDAIIRRNTKLAERDNGAGFWAIEVIKTREIVGSVLLLPLADGAGTLLSEWEVGWHLKRSCWGHGYATEAGRAVIDYGFAELKLVHINAVAYSENAASLRVMDRLEMKHLGKTSKYFGLELEHYRLGNPYLLAGAN